MIDAEKLLADLREFKRQIVNEDGAVTPLELRVDEMIDALAAWVREKN